MAQVEDARRERERAVVVSGIAERDESVQQAARRRPRKAGAARDSVYCPEASRVRTRSASDERPECRGEPAGEAGAVIRKLNAVRALRLPGPQGRPRFIVAAEPRFFGADAPIRLSRTSVRTNGRCFRDLSGASERKPSVFGAEAPIHLRFLRSSGTARPERDFERARIAFNDEANRRWREAPMWLKCGPMRALYSAQRAARIRTEPKKANL